MKINKSKRSSSRPPSNTLFDNDFASGFEDSKFDKFKPAMKVFVGIIVLMTAVWGMAAYFDGTDESGNASKNYAVDLSQQGEDDDSKLLQCIVDANSKNPIPDTSDVNFYPKLISGYDAELACYDQYPDADSSYRRSSVEYARDSALDSSDDYKSVYISSSSISSSSSKNSVTGCDYSLSEGEYLDCSDKYYAAHSSPSSMSPGSSDGSSISSYTPPSNSSASSASSPGSKDGGSSSTGRDDPYAALNACLAEARSMPSEASRARGVQGCYQNHMPRL